MYQVYAISSLIKPYIYVGMTNNLSRRISEHNLGYERTTRNFRPFILIYTKPFNSRLEARMEEKRLKSGYGKEFLKSLV
jgi:putative endonuclease